MEGDHDVPQSIEALGVVTTMHTIAVLEKSDQGRVVDFERTVEPESAPPQRVAAQGLVVRAAEHVDVRALESNGDEYFLVFDAMLAVWSGASIDQWALRKVGQYDRALVRNHSGLRITAGRLR